MKHWYVGLVVPLTAALPLYAAIYKKACQRSAQRLVILYLLLGLVTNFAAVVLGVRHINNLPLLHVYTIFEFVALMLFFKPNLSSRWISSSGVVIIIILTAIGLTVLTCMQSFLSFNTFSRPVAAIILSLTSLYGLYDNFKYGEPFHDHFSNWISAGLLLYFGSALFQFGYANIIYNHLSIQRQFVLGSIHANLVMSMYVLFTCGFIYGKR